MKILDCFGCEVEVGDRLRNVVHGVKWAGEFKVHEIFTNNTPKPICIERGKPHSHDYFQAWFNPQQFAAEWAKVPLENKFVLPGYAGWGSGDRFEMEFSKAKGADQMAVNTSIIEMADLVPFAHWIIFKAKEAG